MSYITLIIIIIKLLIIFPLDKSSEAKLDSIHTKVNRVLHIANYPLVLHIANSPLVLHIANFPLVLNIANFPLASYDSMCSK